MYMWKLVCGGVPEEAEAKMLSDPLELELVTGGCEPPDVNAGNWTHDL